jgi:hypothetical protein
MTDAGFDEWLDAVESGEPYYLEDGEGNGFLPPRRVSPVTGAADLSEEPLPEVGTVETFSVIHVGAPKYAEETPYVTAIAEFGSVRVNGLLRDVDPDDVEVGTTVGLDVVAVDDERTIAFRPR